MWLVVAVCARDSQPSRAKAQKILKILGLPQLSREFKANLGNIVTEKKEAGDAHFNPNMQEAEAGESLEF